MFDSQHILSPRQLARLINDAGQASFVPESLVVDPPLWGGFWHFDVISAGYTLPALELAFLRAVRLDRTWPPDTDLAQFLAELRAAVIQPHAGVWTLSLVGTPLAVFAAPLGFPNSTAEVTAPSSAHRISTVVWYGLASGCLHAGYRAPVSKAHFSGTVCQREPGFQFEDRPSTPPAWLVEAGDERGSDEGAEVDRLDGAILRWRSTRGF